MITVLIFYNVSWAELLRIQKEIEELQCELSNSIKEQRQLINEFRNAKQSALAALPTIAHTAKRVQVQISNQKTLKQTCNKLTQRLKTTKHQKGAFKALMIKYQDFESRIQTKITKLSDKYDQQWDTAEHEWYRWSIDKCVAWFEYILRSSYTYENRENLNKNINKEKQNDKESSNDKTLESSHVHHMNVDNINFSQIISNMKNEKFKCKNLCTLDESDLNSFGFVDIECCHVLLNEAQKICEQYPNLSRNSAKKRRNPVICESNDDIEEPPRKKQKI